MNPQYSPAISLTHSNVARPPQRTQMSDSRINAAAFERFLGWLGPDPETAGEKYEVIRGRLIMMFRARQCVFAEDLADATFERVARKLTQLSTEFTGDPVRYFYGVAKKIYLEYQHEITAVGRSPISLPTPANAYDPDLEDMLKQLDEALNTIPTSDRELILKYYTGTGRNKIDHRRALAEQFGMGLNALRLRVFRIRREIKDYILTGVKPCDTAHRKNLIHQKTSRACN